MFRSYAHSRGYHLIGSYIYQPWRLRRYHVNSISMGIQEDHPTKGRSAAWLYVDTPDGFRSVFLRPVEVRGARRLLLNLRHARHR